MDGPEHLSAALRMESMAQKVKRYKGCCRMCATFVRGDGVAKRLRHRDRKKLGRKRRITR